MSVASTITPFAHIAKRIEVKTLNCEVGDDKPVNEAIQEGWLLKSATVMPGTDWYRKMTVVYIFERAVNHPA